MRSGDCTLYYSGGEKTERGISVVVHKSMVTSVVKIVCNDRIIALESKAETSKYFVNAGVHAYI
jgi:hypothetical protein